ncbi:hypothetical protein BGZ74_008457 [Mortierella antarctica]|nr:hypothetical protein BGZ74_008457 [Mortierella antarctica]
MPIFVLGERIGAGAYGQVFRGRLNNMPVAAKLFYRTKQELHQATIQSEIAILTDLRHRHIIQFYQTVEHDDGHVYLVMDLAEKGSLADAITHGEVSSWPVKFRIAHEIARGLEYMHAQRHRVLHCDLKSANVLLNKHMEVKLGDFGLATVRSLSATNSIASGSEIRKGTLRWMAPELLSSRPMYSTKSDMYAFGTVIWEMAANRTRPFADQADHSVVMELVKNGEREVLPEDTPSTYGMWVERCWCHDRESRPEAMDVILVDTGPWKREETIKSGSNHDSNDFPFGSGSGSVSSSIFTKNSNKSLLDIVLKPFYRGLSSSSNGLRSQSRSRSRVTPNQIEVNSQGESLSQVLKAARRGDQDAQFQLGMMYLSGEGGAIKDEAEAVEWYRMAAQQGHRASQHRLGLLYEAGQGVEQDYKEAATWFRKAADQGIVEAQKRLAAMYSDGRGLDADHAEAFKWYLRIVDQGQDVSTQQGGPEHRDISEAKEMQQLAEQGDAGAQALLGMIYEKGESDEDQRLAAVWYRKAAEQGIVYAQYSLGIMYTNGRGVGKNHLEAFRWHRAAAEQNYPEAQLKTGLMYHLGLGIEKSDVEAARYYLMAAEKGLAEAQRCIASMYDEGTGVEQSYPNAVFWYKKAAEQGHSVGQLNLGVSYMAGRGIEQNIELALHWLRKAAAQNEPKVKLALAMMGKA